MDDGRRAGHRPEGLQRRAGRIGGDRHCRGGGGDLSFDPQFPPKARHRRGCVPARHQRQLQAGYRVPRLARARRKLLPHLRRFRRAERPERGVGPVSPAGRGQPWRPGRAVPVQRDGQQGPLHGAARRTPLRLRLPFRCRAVRRLPASAGRAVRGAPHRGAHRRCRAARRRRRRPAPACRRARGGRRPVYRLLRLRFAAAGARAGRAICRLQPLAAGGPGLGRSKRADRHRTDALHARHRAGGGLGVEDSAARPHRQRPCVRQPLPGRGKRARAIAAAAGRPCAGRTALAALSDRPLRACLGAQRGRAGLVGGLPGAVRVDQHLPDPVRLGQADRFAAVGRAAQ